MTTKKGSLHPGKEITGTGETATAAKKTDAQAQGFPVVGIGASAGGLAAFEAFFSAMPVDVDSDMSFVLVQHLSPDFKSILAELIARYTKMQVLQVEDGMLVKANCVYIIPPNRQMAYLKGTLQLLEPHAPRGRRLPIDFFFRSLAQDQKEWAIGIVLSGNGSDGTMGVRDIKGEGGMVIVQQPESARNDSMPRSAIDTGLVNYVLLPDEMPATLINYVKNAYVTHSYTTRVFNREGRPEYSYPPNTQDAFKKIFILIRAQTGHDFSQYKFSAINRRISRRRALQKIKATEEYVRFLQQTPSEVEALSQDFLIGDTSFFRDPEAFAVLQDMGIQQHFANRSDGDGIRVWIPGCSTGEEAYSIAILIQEYLQTHNKNFKIQMFATDIDGKAIEFARAGRYPLSAVAGLSSERLTRFFTQEPDSGGYRIRKEVRDMLLFSEQDIIKDPPFTNIDLISCRNLMIYMNIELQKKILNLFHYSLNPGGLLFLGKAETAGGKRGLFFRLDRRMRLYQRKEPGYKAGSTEALTHIPTLTENYSLHRVVESGKVSEEPNSAEERKIFNAEIQSTKEDLQACREELQSVNQELAAVNGELQINLIGLSRANDDIDKLLSVPKRKRAQVELREKAKERG